MASKRQLKQLTFDHFQDDIRKKRCDVSDDVGSHKGSGSMEHSGECNESNSDERKCSDESDPESDVTTYDYASAGNDSDCFTDCGHHTNGSGIWHNSINIDQHSNSNVTIVNNQSSVPTKSSLLPPSTSTCHGIDSNSLVIPVVPSDIAASQSQSPVQPILHYPVTILGGKSRSFNSHWYKKYQWLEYSIQRNAVYCFPCRFFGTCNGLGRGTTTFTQLGFCDWKHATGKSGMLAKHDNSFAHKQCQLGLTTKSMPKEGH